MLIFSCSTNYRCFSFFRFITRLPVLLQLFFCPKFCMEKGVNYIPIKDVFHQLENRHTHLQLSHVFHYLKFWNDRKKVQSRQSARLFLQSSELGLPHPSPAGEYAHPPPLVAPSLAGKGWGGVPTPTRGHTLWYSLFIRIFWEKSKTQGETVN